jgi:hypothetical protein
VIVCFFPGAIERDQGIVLKSANIRIVTASTACAIFATQLTRIKSGRSLWRITPHILVVERNDKSAPLFE